MSSWLAVCGTARALKDAGVPVTPIDDVTQFPEMMDGRVKTLHPAIHAGLLAVRDNPEHMKQLEQLGVEPIDMVVINLYPFRATIEKPGVTFDEAIENIDIGGWWLSSTRRITSSCSMSWRRRATFRSKPSAICNTRSSSTPRSMTA